MIGSRGPYKEASILWSQNYIFHSQFGVLRLCFMWKLVKQKYILRWLLQMYRCILNYAHLTICNLWLIRGNSHFELVHYHRIKLPVLLLEVTLWGSNIISISTSPRPQCSCSCCSTCQYIVIPYISLYKNELPYKHCLSSLLVTEYLSILSTWWTT